MKPGDLVRWVYIVDGQPVSVSDDDDSTPQWNEYVWSSVMNKWLPASGISLLISLTRESRVWLHKTGLYHTSVHDSIRRIGRKVVYSLELRPIEGS